MKPAVAREAKSAECGGLDRAADGVEERKLGDDLRAHPAGARLGSRELRAVDEGHGCAGVGEELGGTGARGAGADDDHVVDGW